MVYWLRQESHYGENNSNGDGDFHNMNRHRVQSVTHSYGTTYEKVTIYARRTDTGKGPSRRIVMASCAMAITVDFPMVYMAASSE